MFRSAALSVLSKTLQTFLSKYLVDIDIERVAIPSLLHSQDWGFRISNVKLREGVEIISLPGSKRIVKKKRRLGKKARGKGTQKKDQSKPLGEQTTKDVDNEAGAAKNTSGSEDCLENFEDDHCRNPSVGHQGYGKTSSMFCRSRRSRSDREPYTAEPASSDDEDVEGGNFYVDETSFDEEEFCFDESDTYDYEIIDLEESISLRLGKGGGIGVLDVRLKGSDITVTIEDAVLVFELCTVEKKIIREPSHDKSGKPETKSQPKPNETPDKKLKNESKDFDTSGIARALGVVPNLFVRDCSVHITIQGEEGRNEYPEGGKYNPFHSAAEFNLGFFSITSGEDFRGNIWTSEGKVATTIMKTKRTIDDDYEYVTKRVCTGRGPEGGAWLKLYAPSRSNPMQVPSSDKRWALHQWIQTTEMCMFRCSGVVVQMRIFAGPKQDDTIQEQWGTEYDAYTMDSMLGGFDYVSTGPFPNERDNFHTKTKKPEKVRTVPYPSNFHRMARGFYPTRCKSDHWPSGDCPQCVTRGSNVKDGAFHLPIDQKMPAPGLLIHISIQDPMEINIDRDSLEVMEMIYFLFNRGGSGPETETSEATEKNTSPEASVQGNSLPENIKPEEKQEGNEFDLRPEPNKFPSFMQPNVIHCIGLYIAKLSFRVHMTTEKGVRDYGPSFVYWDTCIRCITLDLKQVAAKELQCQDVLFEIGRADLVEFKGLEKKSLLEFGLPHDSVKDTRPATSSWSSTAAGILRIPVPLDSSPYWSRSGHAFQLRLAIRASAPELVIRARIGEAINASSEAMIYVVRAIFEIAGVMQKNAKPRSQRKKPAKPFGINYRVQSDGGDVVFLNWVKVKFPSVTVAGEMSHKGFVLRAIFDAFDLEVGRIISTELGLNLRTLALMPESARLCIFSFLDDIGPFLQAIGAENSSDYFAKCNSIEKRLLLLTRMPHKKKTTQNSRKKALLEELALLDEAELERIILERKKKLRTP